MIPPAPVLATAATGGTVAAGTYWVKVTAKNAQGETTGSAAAKIVTTGATSTITVTIFTVPNATQYNQCVKLLRSAGVLAHRSDR
jgi:hypothetical protein